MIAWILLIAGLPTRAHAHHVPFAPGDVFVGGNKKDNASFVGGLSGPRYAAGCYE